MRFELGSQKQPPNIIPVDYESQLLCALTIDQSILGRSNALITPLKYPFFLGFSPKTSLHSRTEMHTREKKDRQFIHTKSLRYLRRRSCNNCYLQRFDKIMSMEHARWRYLRSDWTIGCAKVSSALSRCARCLVQKHAKKQHLSIENNNSGPNVTTRP